MPTVDIKLKKALYELALALSKQSIKRQEQEKADTKEIARILAKISKLGGDFPGPQVQDLGVAFSESCATHDRFRAYPEGPKRSK